MACPCLSSVFAEGLATLLHGCAVQAHVVAAIMYQQQQQPGSLDINTEQQASVLATALACTVWQVCSYHINLIAKCVHAVNIVQASGAGQYGTA